MLLWICTGYIFSTLLKTSLIGDFNGLYRQKKVSNIIIKKPWTNLWSKFLFSLYLSLTIFIKPSMQIFCFHCHEFLHQNFPIPTSTTNSLEHSQNPLRIKLLVFKFFFSIVQLSISRLHSSPNSLATFLLKRFVSQLRVFNFRLWICKWKEETRVKANKTSQSNKISRKPQVAWITINLKKNLQETFLRLFHKIIKFYALNLVKSREIYILAVRYMRCSAALMFSF